MSSHLFSCSADIPAAKDLREALRLLQRPRFNLLTCAGEEREVLRQFAHTHGLSLAARHLEARGQFQTAEAAWAAGDELATTLLEASTISTDDRPGFLRRFKTAFFAGYQAYQHEVATARRQAQRQGRQATLVGEAGGLEQSESGKPYCTAHQVPAHDEAAPSPLVLVK